MHLNMVVNMYIKNSLARGRYQHLTGDKVNKYIQIIYRLYTVYTDIHSIYSMYCIYSINPEDKWRAFDIVHVGV